MIRLPITAQPFDAVAATLPLNIVIVVVLGRGIEADEFGHSPSVWLVVFESVAATYRHLQAVRMSFSVSAQCSTLAFATLTITRRRPEMPRLSIRSATVSVSSPAIIAIARFSSGIPIIGSFPISVVPCFKVFSKSAKVAIRSSHVAPRRSGAALSERLLARLALMRQSAANVGQPVTHPDP